MKSLESFQPVLLIWRFIPEKHKNKLTLEDKRYPFKF